MAQIVISEFIDDCALPLLQAQHQVVYDPQLVDKPALLIEQARGAQALIVRNRTQVRGALLEALTQCQVVGRLGVGLDNIDTAGCAARGITVAPATGANAASVAEYVIGTAFVLLRGAYTSTSAVAQGQWPRAALLDGRELAGKTLGLIGFGDIGQRCARLAQALGMTVIAHDALMPPNTEVKLDDGLVPLLNLDALLAQADIISLHVPLNEQTRGLINPARIAAMKPGAILINTARGGVVDEVALAQALQSAHLGGAALDVFEQEPLPNSAHFVNCPNLILTPHIAGLTREANQRVSLMVAQKVLHRLAWH